jgi:hypothetical protein
MTSTVVRTSSGWYAITGKKGMGTRFVNAAELKEWLRALGVEETLMNTVVALAPNHARQVEILDAADSVASAITAQSLASAIIAFLSALVDGETHCSRQAPAYFVLNHPHGGERVYFFHAVLRNYCCFVTAIQPVAQCLQRIAGEHGVPPDPIIRPFQRFYCPNLHHVQVEGRCSADCCVPDRGATAAGRERGTLGEGDVRDLRVRATGADDPA